MARFATCGASPARRGGAAQAPARGHVQPSLLDGWTTTGWRLAPIPQHSGGVNAGFLDGHARWLLLPGHSAHQVRHAQADRFLEEKWRPRP
jgi:prepilin-type processing-associated H-X9-DG protein